MPQEVDAVAVLAALDTTDDFVHVPISVLAVLGPRNAVVLCWLRFRARGGWLAISLAELGGEMNLSGEQVKRAMAELTDAGVVEWQEPDHMSRRRQYRVTVRNRPVDGAKSTRPESAKSTRLPIENLENDSSPSLPLGNGDEGEGTGTHREGNGSSARAARPADPLWDALVAVCGPAVTRPEQSRRGKCVKDLRAAGANPAEVPYRAASFRRLWPRITMTDTALVAHWSVLVPKVKASEW